MKTQTMQKTVAALAIVSIISTAVMIGALVPKPACTPREIVTVGGTTMDVGGACRN